MDLMTWREPTDEEQGRLRERVRELAWSHARNKSGLRVGDPPRNPFDDEALDSAGQHAAVVALLVALSEISAQAEKLAKIAITVAGENGVGGELIAAFHEAGLPESAQVVARRVHR